MPTYDPDAQEGVISETRDEVREPSRYKVFIHNDDYTTMEFVVEILMRIFNRSMEDATLTMLKVHREGAGLCGVYTHEVAETKVGAVHAVARDRGFPLKCTMEKD